MKTKRQPYTPTPAEIRRECERIRQTWDAKRLRQNERYEPPQLREAKERELDLPPG